MQGIRNGSKKSLHFREIIESKGYTLINEYIHEKTRLEMICPNGHERNCLYESFKNSNCKQCTIDAKLKDLVNKIEALDYTFIKYPEHAKDKAIAECSNGHIREAKIHNFLNFGCGECSNKNQLKTIEFCKAVFEERGFTLLEEAYINCKTYMKYRCSCGNVNETTLDTLVHSSITSCNKCKGEKLSGENHWAWNGGVTPDYIKARGTSSYRQWRKSVAERDEYTCQCCTTGDVNIQVHHIDSYAKNENSRFDIHNGISMCISCHDLFTKGSFHHTYGAHNNDIYQLQEYFDDIRSVLGLPLIRIEDIIYPKEFISV